MPEAYDTITPFAYRGNNAADWWPAAEGGVGSVMVVPVDPGLQGTVAGGVGAVWPGIGPLLQQGAVEALHLAVELLWSSGQLSAGLGAVGFWGRSGEQRLEDHGAEPASQAPQGFTAGLAFSLLAGQVGDRAGFPGGLG
jgi:hypothetical protein